MTLPATGPADLRDARRLAVLEETIEASFTVVGRSLTEIRDFRLYRLEYSTFDAYCRDRWKISPQHAGRLISAVAVVAAMEPIGSVPATESQARELAPVLRDRGPEAAAEVLAAAAADGPVTAAAIRAAANPDPDRLECVGSVHVPGCAHHPDVPKRGELVAEPPEPEPKPRPEPEAVTPADDVTKASTFLSPEPDPDPEPTARKPRPAKPAAVLAWRRASRAVDAVDASEILALGADDRAELLRLIDDLAGRIRVVRSELAGVAPLRVVED